MDAYNWYAELIKPSFAPPAWVFAPVWSFLYLLIAISFGRVFWLLLTKRIPFATALPFFLNLIFNFTFTYIQFGLRNNVLAAADVLLVLGTLIWATAAVYRQEKWVAYMQIPYILWASFAALLQLSITFLNI